MKRLPLALLLLITMAATAVANDHFMEADNAGHPGSCDANDCCPADDDLCLADQCFEGCCAGWTGSFNYLYLWRETTGSDFPILETIGNVPVYTSGQFDFDPESGFDISATYNNGCDRGFDIRYMWLAPYTSRQAVFIAPQTRPATDPDTSLSIPNETWDIRYESRVQSVELLRRCECDRVDFTYGFRYINLDEALQLRASNVVNFTYGADNDLYGFQLGTDGTFWDNGCNFRLGGFAKAGIYANDRQVTSDTPFFGRRVDANDTDVAFVGELGLHAQYDVTCCLSFQAGYQLLFLDGVALAANQVPNNGDMLDNPRPVNVSNASLLYHGLRVGLEYRR